MSEGIILTEVSRLCTVLERIADSLENINEHIGSFHEIGDGIEDAIRTALPSEDERQGKLSLVQK